MIGRISLVRTSPSSARRRPSSVVLTVAVCVLVSSCTGGSAVTARPQGSEQPIPSQTITELVIRPTTYRLHAPIQRTVAVRNGGTVVIAGGLDAGGSTVGGVFILNPTSGHLTELGSLATPVHDATGVMVGTRLFVFGGGSNASSDVVQAFDLATRTGTVVGRLPHPLSDLASASVGGTTYLVGGYDGRSPRREIYATTDGIRFRLAGTLPIGLRYPAVAAAGDTVIVAGGMSNRGPSSTIYAFDPSSGAVRTIGTLPRKIAQAAAFALDGSVYVVGGAEASGRPVSSVSRVDPATREVTPQPPLHDPLADTSVAAGSGDVILVGGHRGAQTVDTVLMGSLRTVAGQSPSPGPSPSGSPGAAGGALGAAATRRPFAGLLLIADRGNDRLLVMNAKKRVVWRYPSRRLPSPPQPLYFPDDAFWVHGGHAILVNEEENHTLLEIGYPSGRVLWTYGHPRRPGASPGYLNQPDDLYPYPGGGIVVADAKNCRILFFDKTGWPSRQIGRTGACIPGLPHTVGYPNGDTPLANGNLLISELIGHWVDEVTPRGRVVWARQVPGVVEPSDPQPLGRRHYLVASYSRPGALVIFDRTGRVIWTYGPTSGPGMLDHPSLAAPLPNGLIAVNDDRNHRVLLIDRRTNRIVWQYGRTGVSGSASGLLSFPDGLDLLLPRGVIPLHVDFSSRATRRGRP
jgi:outer membrane protein assembly factor BamB